MVTRRYRVAQLGTGHTGLRSLEKVIKHPYYDLVGVRVFSESKEGKDAGELCGLPPTGVRATCNIADIVAAKPDCVIHMPLTGKSDIGEMAHLLESGINIVSLVAEWHFRDTIKAEERSVLEAACEKGRSSLYSTGPSPGFATEILPFAITTMMRELDHFRIHEFADMRSRSTGDMLASMFGWEPGTRSIDHVAEHMRNSFGDSLRQTAAQWGLPLDELTSSGEVACATQDVTVAGVTVEAGTVAAWQFETVGWHKGKPLMTFANTWFLTRDLDKDWETRDTGWRFTTKGDAPLLVDLYFDRENFIQTQASFSANPCVNAVPQVCAARPGILHTVDLPVITSIFG